MARWRKDLILAIRALLRRPAFTLTVIVTLALGVGANTALFGVFRAVFLEPLPLPDPDEVVVVMEAGTFGCCGPASGPDYLDWVERQRSFEGMAILAPRTVNVAGEDDSERVYGTAVSANAFALLDVAPLMGRPLLPDDDRAEVPEVTVVSHAFWRRALGSRPDVLGSTVVVDGSPLTVVGVMPAGFDVPSPWLGTRRHEIYLPFPAHTLAENRGNHSWPVIARLRPDASLETAQSDMDRIMAELALEYPETNAQRTARVFTVHEYLYGDVGQQLLLILGAAALVLLIACGNVAGLQLARATTRETELSVRAALGASRRALVRLLFSESLALAALGGALGLVVALAAVDGLRLILPPTIPRLDAVRVDGWAMLFGIAAATGTAFAFGLLPALLASRTDLASGVREGGYGTLAPRKEKIRDAFIVSQIALGLILVNGAVLLVRNYAELRGLDQGFETDGVLTFAVNAAGPRYENRSTRLRFYEDVAGRIEALPSVESAGVVSKLPLGGGSNGNVWIEGTPPRRSSDEGPLVEVSSVSGAYFDAMGIPLLRGRALVAEDSLESAVGVVVNQALADVAWPEADPLGKRFSFGDDPPAWLTVVGVVGDVRQWGPERPPLPEVYFPYTRGWSSSAYVVARVRGDAAAIAEEVRAAVLDVDPTQPPSEVLAMDDRVDRAFARRRFYASLIGLFALSALLLAAAGIYGTVSYFVARRSREFGIRIALGARGPGIVGLVLRRGVRLATLGVVFGLAGVWASTSVVESLLYGTGALHMGTLVLCCVALGLVTLVACALPAGRAAHMAPVLALKSE